MTQGIKLNFSSMYIIVLSLSMTACAYNAELRGKPETRSLKNEKHTHPANKCIDAVSHAHPNGKKKHQHHYHTCKENSSNSNAHSHPSNSITGFTRHVHPNGANPHTHGR